MSIERVDEARQPRFGLLFIASRQRVGDDRVERFELMVRKKKLQYESLRMKLKELQTQVRQREKELSKLRKQKKQAVKNRITELMKQNEKVVLK